MKLNDLSHYVRWELDNFADWALYINEYLQERARRFYRFIERDKTLKYGVVMTLLFSLMFVMLETFGDIGIIAVVVGSIFLWIISALKGRMKLYEREVK